MPAVWTWQSHAAARPTAPPLWSLDDRRLWSGFNARSVAQVDVLRPLKQLVQGRRWTRREQQAIHSYRVGDHSAGQTPTTQDPGRWQKIHDIDLVDIAVYPVQLQIFMWCPQEYPDVLVRGMRRRLVKIS
jgi:hypothetical protein